MAHKAVAFLCAWRGEVRGDLVERLIGRFKGLRSREMSSASCLALLYRKK